MAREEAKKKKNHCITVTKLNAMNKQRDTRTRDIHFTF